MTKNVVVVHDKGPSRTTSESTFLASNASHDFLDVVA